MVPKKLKILIGYCMCLSTLKIESTVNLRR